MPLPAGTHPVAAGQVAAVVTHLERDLSAPIDTPPPPAGVVLRHVPDPDLDWYRALFGEVGGRDWMWFSRLAEERDALAGLLARPEAQIFAVRDGSRDVGMMELLHRGEVGRIEFLGLTRGAMGQGTGRWLMGEALTRLKAAGARRAALNTCTLDSPRALPFYRAAGFTAVRREVQVFDDPRLTGVLPRGAAPTVPIIE